MHTNKQYGIELFVENMQASVENNCPQRKIPVGGNRCVRQSNCIRNTRMPALKFLVLRI